MTNAPDAITRYLKSADERDAQALAACFTDDGSVVDEGKTYRGRAEIIGWRENLASQFEYTTEVLSSEPASEETYRVTVRVVGNFPGGTADLGYDFELRDGLISALSIG
jgi:ketosteroid isomerase-like protein